MTLATASPGSARPRATYLQPETEAFHLRLIEGDDDRLQLADELERRRLMYRDNAFFMSQLTDERGTFLTVDEHQEAWCQELRNPLLCLLAPRDHGKTWTLISYVLWRVWRHNRDPETTFLRPGLPEGRWEAVLFSATKDQAVKFFESFQSLMLSNERLFSDILPDFKYGKLATIRNVWSRSRSRLKNRAEVSIRAFQTSTRGLHPDLLVLDDVLHDKNALTKYQRDKVWRYFVGTLLPMNAKQVLVVGTAFHFDDLLHRLRPAKIAKGPADIKKFRFVWRKYRALVLAVGKPPEALWPAKHPVEELLALREFDATEFAREYQNDPTDDASSMFPKGLTDKARDETFTFVPLYRKNAAQEFIIGGYDVAASAEVGADFAVLWIATVDRQSGLARVLHMSQHKGLGFPEQITLLRDACRLYQMDLMIVEENGLQKWLKTELDKHPETAHCILGHTTGQEKADFSQGVPSLKIGLANGTWKYPIGDEECLAAFKVWQNEMAAFGWRDGKLQGLGEHDDTVMGFWFLDRAKRLVYSWTNQPPAEEVVYAEDIGINPVHISDYD